MGVTVLTSRRETFSMPCAESLCCGTPVVGFRCGGAETVALEAYSRFVAQGNLAALAQAVAAWLARPVSHREIARAAAERYGPAQMCDGFAAVYEALWNKEDAYEPIR